MNRPLQVGLLSSFGCTCSLQGVLKYSAYTCYDCNTAHTFECNLSAYIDDRAVDKIEREELTCRLCNTIRYSQLHQIKFLIEDIVAAI